MNRQDSQTRSLEYRHIELATRFLKRHPAQLNRVFCADAELLPLGDGRCLACTTDTLYEEILLGILEDPWRIGWTAVTVCLSDLAAVAASPLGLLMSWNIPPQTPDAFVSEVSRGIGDAAAHHNTYVLGGDMNEGKEFQLCGTALGIVPGDRCMQRCGMQPGDRLFVTGRIGLGNALGCAKLLRLPNASALEGQYRPEARLAAGALLSRFATACVDTSDGLVAALDLLADLNTCGVLFRSHPNIYHPDARLLSRQTGIPLWLFSVAEHGEFELLAVVPDERCRAMLEACRAADVEIIEIGAAVQDRRGVSLEEEGRQQALDLPYLHSLSGLSRHQPAEYVQRMLAYASRFERILS